MDALFSLSTNTSFHRGSNEKNIGNNIREIRLSKEMSLALLSEKLGVTRAAVCRNEKMNRLLQPRP